MSLNPLKELKRRLDDEETPLSKRLCLAKNVVKTHHFPAAPKERIIGDWLYEIIKDNKVTNVVLRDILSWLMQIGDLTAELRSKVIEIVAHYVAANSLQSEDIASILLIMANDRICQQLQHHISDFLLISKILLGHLKMEGTLDNLQKSQKILNNYVKFYRESKLKLEFITKFIEGDNLEIIFECLEFIELRDTALNVCQTILFPMTKKTFFSVFLQTLLKKNSIDELMEEKGDNMQSVVKIMNVFFTYPDGRTSKDPIFLQKYIDTFVSSFRTENQMVFAFFIMAVNSLNMEQNYFSPTMKMPAIQFEKNNDKIKRTMLLHMFKSLLDHEIDINVRLTDTFKEKASKIEIKKTLGAFLQAVILNQLKLEGKPDKMTLQIITTALKLDPVLIEQKMNQILPPIMIAKKTNSNIANAYEEMLDCFLGVLFKLSRGTMFINQVLPHLKLLLEARNFVQLELKKNMNDGADSDKVRAKIIQGEDLFPKKCVEKYGRLTSELMFRQNVELLISLQRDFEDCLMMLEEGFITPSVIIIAEVMSAILCAFFENCKMADHSVPQHIANEFWTAFEKFENDVLKKFGVSLLKFNFDSKITLAYLKLCLGYSQLKILNMQYSHVKITFNSSGNPEDVFNLSMVLPCLDCNQWNELAKNCKDDECASVFDNLLILKIIVYNLNKTFTDVDSKMASTRTYLIEEIGTKLELPNSKPYFLKVLLSDLNSQQTKQFSKSVFKTLLLQPELAMLDNEIIYTNKQIASAFLVEILKCLMKLIEKSEMSPSFSRAVTKSNFDICNFCKNISDMGEYFNQISLNTDFDEDKVATANKCFELLKQLKIYNLEENYVLATLFVLFAFKKASDRKKLKKTIDGLLQVIFELSPKSPDVFKIYPIEFIFSFGDNIFFDLATLNVKNSNRLLIVKSILHTAVKKVKTDCEIVRKTVKILLSNQKNKDGAGIEYFSNNAFQITCIILPLIAKEKKAITTSAFRSTLADLQEKLHKSVLKSFKSINFNKEGVLNVPNTDESVLSDDMLATLNAMDAYTLTLSKYCETPDVEEIKNLDCLWYGLEYFVHNAIISLRNPELKPQHVTSTIQLINTVFRNIRKLETHDLFQNKDKLFLQIWQSLKERLVIIFRANCGVRVHINCTILDNISVTLKFLSELSSIDCFLTNFVGDMSALGVLKKPTSIQKEDNVKSNTLVCHRVSKFLLTSILKTNIVGPKCVAITKYMYRTTKNLTSWIRQHYDFHHRNMEEKENKKYIIHNNMDEGINNNVHDSVTIEDYICNLLVTDLDMISEVVLAAKKISLSPKFLDALFELQHMAQYVLGGGTLFASIRISWESFFLIYQSCLSILNSLLLSREQLLEDRWPCYLQSYRRLVSLLCEKSTSQTDLEIDIEERLAELGHSVEKLTQAICKRKSHIARLAMYTVADICSWLERTAPSRLIRQHLENCVVLLIQVSDSTYSASFLRRALAGSPGHMTVTNLYTMYKRYHKYVGNS